MNNNIRSTLMETNRLKRPLDGVKVLDLSRVLSGPFCGALLGDMGADVIKIEDLDGGDETRMWPPRKGVDSAAFLVCNRNKRGMTLDLTTLSGQEIFIKLVKNSDVVLENYRSGVMEKFDLGYERLNQVNPRLVYCGISAFGRFGPLANTAGYEAVLQAWGGVMSMTGEFGRDPVRCGLSFIDLSTGIMAGFAIMNALLLRATTGLGQKVECSLLQTNLALLNYHAQAYLMDGTVNQAIGSSHPSLVPYRNYKCNDNNFVFIGGANQRFWPKLCKVLGLEDLIKDQRFVTNLERVKNRIHLDQLIGDAVAIFTSKDLLQLLSENGVPSAPVNTLDKFLNQPQLDSGRMIEEINHPRLGPTKIIGVPLTALDMDIGVRMAAPDYSEHTVAILKELGYFTADIAKLRDNKIFI